MRYNQMTLSDIYTWVGDSFESDRTGFFSLLRKHIDWDEVIPVEFHFAYHADTGRKRRYSLESMIAMLVLQKVFGFTTDAQLLDVLKNSRELRDFCGFRIVPDAAQVTRFKQRYADHLHAMLDVLVELTEPICREMDAEKADCLVLDTTGIESHVKENNPKFFNSKLRQAKRFAKSQPDFDPYKGVYGLLPDCAESNWEVRQQYLNGHFCYAQKVGILTNGLGIIRDIQQFGAEFKSLHPEMKVGKRSGNPDADKEISDSTSLKPVLSDFFNAHPNLKYGTFLGDSAFDSYDNYSLLLNDFNFSNVLIPLNARNSVSAHSEFNEFGTPLCPTDGSPLTYLGKSGGENRSERLKFICPKSVSERGTRTCKCESPCTDSVGGRAVYTYPNKNQRLYPGIARDSEQWTALYKHRTAVERTNAYLKVTFGSEARRTSNVLTTRSDLLIGGITQLLGVLLANSLHKLNLAGRVRTLLRAA